MMTDTPLETDGATALERVVTSTDANTLGRYWLGAGSLALLASLLAGVLVALERLDLGGAEVFGSADEAFQFWSAHRVGLVLLAIVPILVGLGTAVAPLQVGSDSIAFPRMAAFSFWTWLIGAGTTVTGFLIDGGLGAPDAGGQRQAVALTLVGLLMVIGGLLGATVSLLTTIVCGRVVGLTLHRIPLFSWTLLVAGTFWLLTLPVLAANVVLAYVDLRGRTAVRFGAEDAIWEQLSWAFSHPQVYAFALPLVGIAFDIVPVSVRNRLVNHNAVLVLTTMLGVFGFGAYAQSFFDTPGTPVLNEAIYVVYAFAALLVALALFGGLADTLRRGAANLGSGAGNRPPAPMVLSVLAMLLLLVAAAVGALRAVDPFDLLGTSATGAQMTLTMGAAFVGAMAGTLWWGDRIFGRVSSQGLGLLAGLAAVVGVLLLGIADLLSGFMGQNDFTGASVAAAGSPDSGVDALNLVALVGTVLLLVGAIGWFANGIRRLTGVAAPADPWGGHTLEWAADPSSVEVTSERPLLDALENSGVTS